MTSDAPVQLICLEPSLVITSVKKHANRNPFYPFLASGSAHVIDSAPTGPEPFQLVTWLMALLFYSSDRLHAHDHAKQRFLSYVETQHELSIVFEDSLLSIFPEQTLEFEPIRWKALQVASAGAGAFLNQLATLTELTTQLARHNISVFQISTYQTDYILVKIEDLDRAIRCLQSFCDVEMEDGTSVSPKTCSEKAELLYPSLPSLSMDPVLDNVSHMRQHTLSVPDMIDLYLVQIDKSCVRRHMFDLVRLLFGQSTTASPSSNDGKVFLSYSESGDDISVVTSDLQFIEQIRRLASRGEPGVMVSPDCWKVVQIGDKHLGFAETGIVAGHTRVLLNAGTMVFYLSTYATDFMLIKEDEWDDALHVLQAHFKVVQGGFVPLTQGDVGSLRVL